jgi:hypothetical protein
MARPKYRRKTKTAVPLFSSAAVDCVSRGGSQRGQGDLLLANTQAGEENVDNNKCTLSTSVQREIWGQYIFNLEYAFELRLTRAF